MRLIAILCVFLFRSYNCISSSSDCDTQLFRRSEGHGIFSQYFYSLKTPSIFECMEICSQYPLCKSLSFNSGRNCHLKRNTVEDAYMFGCYCGEYYPATAIPERISGVCTNNNCSINTRCMPVPSTGNYVCVPHNFPTFDCPNDWVYFRTKCYYFSKTLLAWQDAKDACSSLESNLTEIRSNEEQAYLKSLLKFIEVAPRGYLYLNIPEKAFWTSLLYQQETWAWNKSEQTLVNTSFTAWVNNHNSLLNPNQTNCMALSNVTDFLWMVADCSLPNFSICEKIMVP